LGQEHESVSDLFRVLDTDGNGSISREEFIAGFDLYQKEEARLAAEARVAKVARLAEEARALEKPLVKTAEQLAADAELAELRRLTPEQEAAAAKAAQRIGEVAAAAEAAPEEERAAATRLDGKEAWATFGGGTIEPLLEHTPLIDLEYLVALAEGGGVMPCGRQNVPPAAFITKRNLWRLKLWGKGKIKNSLGVLVLSYPWLDWFHPDRLGAQLRRLLPFLKAMLAAAKEDSPHCTVGVMIDFLCLPQKPFATEEDGARFGVSLKAINAWYFHERTYTLLVTNPPPEGADYSNTRLHRDRGWCFFEQAASMVVKDRNCLLDFGAYEGATEFGNAFNNGPGNCLGQMKAGRKPPIAPDAFGERMRARVASGELTFTANADMGFVIGQYEVGFVAAINRVAAELGNTRFLSFRDLGWGDAEAAELRLALQYAAAKCAFPEGAVRVNVIGNPISEEALATLPPREGGDFTGERAVWEGKFCIE
jgi:hypothetical protein